MLPWFWRLWGLYLPHDLFIFLFVSLVDFLSFLQIFFSGWILRRSPKEIRHYSKLVWNLIEQERVEQRPGVLSRAAYLLCILPRLMNIQSCTGSLSGFQSLSFFRFPSLAMALFFPPTQGRKNTEKHPHTHTYMSHTNTMVAGKATWYWLQSWIFIHTCFRQKVFSRFRRYLDGTLDLSSFVWWMRAGVCACLHVCVSVFSTAVASVHLIGSATSLFLHFANKSCL